MRVALVSSACPAKVRDMAGAVHHKSEDRLLSEVIHWIMDSEPLTTPEERRLYGDSDVDDADEMKTSLCMQCGQPFAQPSEARRRRVFCGACR